jgi:hypothetical protein
MRYVKHKWFWAWDYEKEEKWLNEMSAKGLQLVSVGFFKYVFEDGEKGKYIYRLEMLENLVSSPESISYIKFLEETGVEFVGSVFRWSYFRKKAEDGSFDIYSDIPSRMNHYRRILAIFLVVFFPNLTISITNFINYINSGHKGLLYVSMLNLSVSFLLLIGVCVIGSKIRKLKKEKIIKE